MENIQTFAFSEDNHSSLSPDNPHWNWLSALGIWFLSIFAIFSMQLVFVGILIASKGIKLDESEFANFLKNDPSSIFFSILSIIPAHLITLLIAWFYVTKNKQFSFKESLGWQMNGFNVWIAVIIIGLFYVISAGLIWIFGEQSDEFQKILQSSKATLYVMAFMATFSAPIIEEIIYRGIVYSAFYKQFGAFVAIIVASILFASVHYMQYWGNYASLIGITLFSFVLTFVRYKTKNLLPCILLHFLFNGSQCLLLIISSLIEQPSVENPAFHIFK